MSLPAEDRLREEDPYTEFIIRDVPNRIVVHRSRFAVDLNRSPDQAIYLRPEQSWGLRVWSDPPDATMVARGAQLPRRTTTECWRRCSRAWRRSTGGSSCSTSTATTTAGDGPDAPPASPDAMPEINIGTFSMDRRRWGLCPRPVDRVPWRDRCPGPPIDRSGRTSPSRERASRRGSSTRSSPRPVVRLPSSSRSSSWTNGPACPTGTS